MGTARDDSRLIAHLTDAVVVVETDVGMGSGTVLFSDKTHTLILTNYHVIDGGKSVWIQYNQVKQVASIEASNEDKDLALLQCGATGLPAAPIAKQVTMYERVYVIGNHLGMEDTVADGILTSLRSHPYGLERELFRLTGFFIYGVSGGAVFNLKGELIAVPEILRIYPTPVVSVTKNGITETPYQAITPITQVGYAVPLADIKEFLKPYKL
jgi:S1-C subfamily serine protease